MKIKKLILTSAVAGMVLVSVTTVALAASIVQNGSFESGTDPDGNSEHYIVVYPGNTDINNWTVDSGNVEVIGSRWAASDGDRSIDLSGYYSHGSISQTFATVTGQDYKVQFDLAGNIEGPPTIKTMTVEVAGTTHDFEFDISGKNKDNMDWETKNFEFTATDTTSILTFKTAITSAFGPVLDNVIVEEIIPPPADTPTPTEEPVPTDAPIPTPTVMPADKEECKKDGWDEFGVFNNQGDCVSYVETDGQNEPANQ